MHMLMHQQVRVYMMVHAQEYSCPRSEKKDLTHLVLQLASPRSTGSRAPPRAPLRLQGCAPGRGVARGRPPSRARPMFGSKTKNPAKGAVGVATGVGPIRPDTMAPCGNSSLSFLGEALHLVTYFSGSQTLMASHFLRHYIDVIRVHPSRMRFFVDRGGSVEQTERTLEVVRAAGVPRASVSVISANYTERVRLHHVNEHMSGLPKGSYLINADIDELFSYPYAGRVGRPPAWPPAGPARPPAPPARRCAGAAAHRTGRFYE